MSEAKHSSGMYTCTLYDLTKPDGNTFKEVDIVVDERLTCAPNGSKSLFGCKPSLMSELWVSRSLPLRSLSLLLIRCALLL